MMKYFFLFLSSIISLSFLINTTIAQQLYINEILATNNGSISDPDFNAFVDWIEVYNAESYAVNLNGYYISDDIENLTRYRFQVDIIIPAKGFALIWADDKDTLNHTNFKLSSSGGSVILLSPDKIIIDSISYSQQSENVSWGRYPDGGGNKYYFVPSTPLSTNTVNGIYNKLDAPVFSSGSGFFNNSFLLTLSHSVPGTEIRYTSDGSTPTEFSTLYTQPISIDSTIIITARAFKENYIPSKSVINSYFVNFNTSLPIFSIVTDPANFFSDTSGIFVVGTNGITGRCMTVPVNWNQDWERPVNLEFFESDKSLQFSLQAGVKIFGGCTRKYPMKSLALYFRSEYGEGKLNYRLFQDLPINKYDRFLLRSSSQDWWRTMFRDGMIQTLVKEGMNIEYQEYRPSILFLNGQYWGIHNIREKVDAEYLNARFGVDESNIDLITMSSTGYATDGDLTAYRHFVNFYTENSLAVKENYEYIKTLMDVDQYIDYYIAEIYSANADWPGSNMKLWRTRNPAGKWRWLMYDIDMGFGGNAKSVYNYNTLEFATATDVTSGPNPPWATLLFRKLLENQEFRNEFIQRTAVHMNTTFEVQHVLNVIDSIKTLIADEIPRHKERWAESLSLGSTWDANVEIMREFAQKRQSEMRRHYNSKFNLSGAFSLIISRNNPDWGKILLHSVEMKRNGAMSIFFENIPLKVKAVANPGYKFVRWEGITTSSSPEIEIVTNQNSSLTAVFEKAELTVTTPVINEINYKSSPFFDTEDWIEIYNPGNESIDMTGWKLMDDNISNQFTFSPGTVLPGEGYLVICRDSVKFKQHSATQNVIGNLNFGLSSTGDMVLLYDNSGKLTDSVAYGVDGDWPALPNGNGPTLSLINPQTDNSLPVNWRASINYGTPGRINDVYTGAEDELHNNKLSFYLHDNYPNPFNSSTQISFSVPEKSMVSLIVYDLLGRELLTLVNEERPAGNYTINFQAENMVSGIYFYNLQSGSNSITKKMILLK